LDASWLGDEANLILHLKPTKLRLFVQDQFENEFRVQQLLAAAPVPHPDALVRAVRPRHGPRRWLRVPMISEVWMTNHGQETEATRQP
jgi:hypothetical protein